MSGTVYINDIAAFLPGEPVGNDEMESVLGRVNGKPSRARPIVLRRNGIKRRYYVLDPETGKPRYTNAQLTAEAVRALQAPDFNLQELQCLACGTSSPDQIMPNHGVMVHGELKIPPCEIASLSGICVSGISALKYAYMNVLGGLVDNAVATGSEVSSISLQARFHEVESESKLSKLESHPEIAFEQDFLRWMLSDGAGAMRLSPRTNPDRLSLRIEWIEQISYANEQPACMYGGAGKREDGSLMGWREFDSLHAAIDQSVFVIKQDVKQLNEHIVTYTVERGLTDTLKRHPLKAGEVDWFVPHYSSEYFRDKLREGLRNVDFDIPEEKWFTNLTEVGNVGSASIYLMLGELMRSDRLRPGEKILCYIPESGRFSTAFMLLSVVAP